MNEIVSALEKTFPKMIEWRRHFHQHPELSFQEVNTPEKIAQLLTKFGLEVKRNIGGRGVIGVVKGDKPGKTVALRADFDALPIQDEKDVPYKSTVPGVMHACGHDAHTATLLGIASVLSQYKQNIAGNIVFIHQFAEELAPGGAKPMIEDGCLEGVDVIFGTHLWSEFPVGTIAYRKGYIMAASDRFEIEIQGKGGHGAMPHQTLDSVVIGSQLVQTMQQLVSRRIDPLKPAVVTVGSFHAGNTFNVIADKAVLEGTVRTLDEETRDQLQKEIEQVVQSTCQTFGATYRYQYHHGYPPVYNHSQETEFMVQIASEVVGSENVFETSPLMIGEDFAFYLQHVPGTFFFTGARNEQKNAVFPHHHPHFDIDEQAMLIAAKTLTSAALSYLHQ